MPLKNRGQFPGFTGHHVLVPQRCHSLQGRCSKRLPRALCVSKFMLNSVTHFQRLQAAPPGSYSTKLQRQAVVRNRSGTCRSPVTIYRVRDQNPVWVMPQKCVNTVFPCKLVLDCRVWTVTPAGWPDAHSDNAKLMHSCANTGAGTYTESWQGQQQGVEVPPLFSAVDWAYHKKYLCMLGWDRPLPQP